MITPSLHPSTMVTFVDKLTDLFARDDGQSESKLNELANVKRLQDQYRAVVRGDVSRLATEVADDAEYELYGIPELPFIRRASGHQKFLEAVGFNFSLLKNERVELLDVVAQGNLLTIFAHEQTECRATGRFYDLQWVQLFCFKDGKMNRFRCLVTHTSSW